MIKASRRFCVLRSSFSVLFAMLLFGLSLANAQEPEAARTAPAPNRLLEVKAVPEGGNVVLKLRTDKPLGYRYTIYDSQDPLRVIVDFPGMTLADLEESIPVDALPLTGVKLSSFELTSGDLARVEVLLDAPVDYEVSLEEPGMHVLFSAAEPTDEASMTGDAQPGSPAAELQAQAEPGPAKEPVGAVEEGQEGEEAERIQLVEIDPGQVVLVADGPIESMRYFPLTGPSRLVVDLYGVAPGFSERAFSAEGAFSGLRVGPYEDKTRFVLDASSEELPRYTVLQEQDRVVIAWGDNVGTGPETGPGEVEAPARITGVDFTQSEGTSLVSIRYAGAAEVIKPVVENGIIRFGLRDATISRALRRLIDTSAFPSAVALVAPFTVRSDDRQAVKFAVKLKGPTGYGFDASEGRLSLMVEDGPFAEPAPPAATAVPLPISPPPAKPEPAEREVNATEVDEPEVSPAVPMADEQTPAASGEGSEPKYTGQKISLVFDEADIRHILKLIGEVSDLNIIAAEDVSGTINLRLIDVPWDQALDLILDVKNLGMVKVGNVVRIMPKDKIREEARQELSAEKEKQDLLPLVTEVVSVSYTDLGNVAGPVSELLTERGKVTPDARNKQLIVRDIQPVIDEVKKLVTILDTPERQVIIEARIVEASSNFARDLGINWNINFQDDGGGSGIDTVDRVRTGFGGDFFINPPAASGFINTSGFTTGITFGKVGVDTTTIDLVLSALESSGHGKIISNPRVTTLNGEQASIKQGTKIPYQSVSEEGTQTEFIDAVLSLNVKPEINPDNSIILEVVAKNDSPSTTTGATAPSIDNKEAQTKVLVKDGETTVIGGIFVERSNYGETGVPWLKSIPILGHLFKSQFKDDSRAELLIFITPRIVR